MEQEIPDFRKDWTELKDDKKARQSTKSRSTRSK